jgi:hypothetical protein
VKKYVGQMIRDMCTEAIRNRVKEIERERMKKLFPDSVEPVK